MQNDRVKSIEDSRFRILTEISQQITSILDINELLIQVVRLIQRTFDYYHVGIGLIEKDEVVYRVGAGELWDDPNFQFKPSRLKVGSEGITGWVAYTGKPVLASDVTLDPHYVWMQGSLTKSELMVPITVKGETIGVLDVQSQHINEFEQTDSELMQAIANQAGIAIENARLFSETQRLLTETEERNTELSIINSMQLGLATKLDMKGIYELVGEKLRGIFGVNGIVIYSFDHERRLVISEYAYEKGKRYEIPPLKMTPLHNRVISTGETICVQQNAKEFFEEYKHTMPAGEMPHSFIIVPFKIQGRVAGMIGLEDTDREFAFSESDVRLTETLSNSMVVALESARLFAETQRLLKETEQRASELAIINNVQQGLASKLDVQSIYDLVGNTFRDIFDAQVVMISTYDPKTNTVRHRYAIERGERVYSQGTHPPGGFRTKIIQTRQPLLVNTNVAEDATLLGQPTLPGTTTPKSWLGVPMLVGGEVTGILSVQNVDEENAFGESDIRFLQTFAASMSIALENARLFSNLERRAEQFRVLTEVSQHIISLASVDEILNRIAQLVKEAFGYIHVGIGLVYGDQVVSKAEVGAFEDAYRASSIPLGEGIWGKVAQAGISILSNQVNGVNNHKYMHNIGIHSHLCVPLKIKDRVIGVMSAASDHTEAFDQSDENILQTLANQVSVAIDNARLYEQARHLAVLDERQRLARELHDSVTQSLYGISLYAQAAMGNFNANQVEQVRQYLDDIQNTSQESLADMRLLIYELRPPILDKEGLIAALQNRLISVEDRARIKSSIQTNLTGRLPAQIEEGLYQITREALNNIIKHAHAKNVLIQIQKKAESISMEISDDGVGFDPETACRQGCLGLTNMKERAQSQGWQLDIESSPGNGALIKVEIKQP